jgi:adenosylcobinamide-GDP ribazoletransferase
MTDRDSIQAQATDLLADFRAALAFLTAIPARALGRRKEESPNFSRGARVFPLVGAVVGFIGGVVVVVCAMLGLPALVTAALAITVVVLATGAFHEDGLADTADGFGGGGTTVRKLEIMDDSRIGTFGTVALILSLLLRVAALAAIVPDGGGHAMAALIAAEAASRGAMVRLWHELPAARPGGMGERTGPPDQEAMLIALIGAAIIVALAIVPTFGFWAAIVALVVVILTAFGFARLTAHQIGGQTGDTLGACQQVTVAAFLISIAAFA